MTKKRTRHHRQRNTNPWRHVPNPPSDFVVPPTNPPGFGLETPDSGRNSPLVSGTRLFDDPFYTVLPGPPLGRLDPTYDRWLAVVAAAQARIQACPPRAETAACDAAREAYNEAARQYAFALDDVWGLNRFEQDPLRNTGPKKRT